MDIQEQTELLRRNVELRLTEIQLRLEIESWQQAAADWQQVAIAAVAKADALERQLNQK